MKYFGTDGVRGRVGTAPMTVDFALRLASATARVLAPGGVLMLIFQIGDEQAHRTDFRGTPISADWYRQRPDDLANLLQQAGFDLWTTAVRQPEGRELTEQGYILARKPLSG